MVTIKRKGIFAHQFSPVVNGFHAEVLPMFSRSTVFWVMVQGWTFGEFVIGRALTPRMIDDYADVHPPGQVTSSIANAVVPPAQRPKPGIPEKRPELRSLHLLPLPLDPD